MKRFAKWKEPFTKGPQKNCKIPLIWNVQNVQLNPQKSRGCGSVVVRGWGAHNGEELLSEYELWLWTDGNDLKVDRDDSCTTLSILNAAELLTLKRLVFFFYVNFTSIWVTQTPHLNQ